MDRTKLTLQAGGNRFSPYINLKKHYHSSATNIGWLPATGSNKPNEKYNDSQTKPRRMQPNRQSKK
jgi:hypothetical protein